MHSSYKYNYTNYSSDVKALIIIVRIRDGRRYERMNDIINTTVPFSTDEILALKAVTKRATTKDAVRDAVLYRIAQGGKKA